MYNFINYPKCSTCKNLKDILDKNNIKYNNRDIKLDNPSKLELNPSFAVVTTNVA